MMVKKKDTGSIYAMKVLKKEMILKRRQYDHTMSERRILGNVAHPFIVALRFSFQTDSRLFMVFDLYNGGELYYYLSESGEFGVERSRLYAYELALALEHLHSLNIAFRDLKPENVILDADGHVRLVDFGLSKEQVEGESIKSICGTPEYLAPEILRRQPYGIAVDWWSLGTLLYEMIHGLPPFYSKSRQTMYRQILEAPLTFPSSFPADAADLCRKLLDRDPKRRLSGKAVLEHPFFSCFDRERVLAKDFRPPWVPTVTSETDTRNIAPEFTAEVAGVTPSPATHGLKEAMGATPPSFSDFSYTHSSALGTFRVSFSEPSDEELAAMSVGSEDEDDAAARRAEAEALAALGPSLGAATKPPPEHRRGSAVPTTPAQAKGQVNIDALEDSTDDEDEEEDEEAEAGH